MVTLERDLEERNAAAAAALSACKDTGWLSKLLLEKSLTFNEMGCISDPLEWSSKLRHHFVIGERSPFRFIAGCLRGNVETELQFVFAVHVTENAGNSAHAMQGGAVSSIFDFICAWFAAAFAAAFSGEYRYGAFGLTRKITVQMLRPAQPLPGVFKVSTEILPEESAKDWKDSGVLVVNAELSDGFGKIFARAQTEQVDLEIRQAFRAKQAAKSKL